MPAFLLACLAFVLPHARIVSGPEQHPGRARAVRSLPGLCKLPTGCGEGEATLVRVLSAAGFDREPQRVSELTAGFCNSVFLVELPSDARIGDETVVVVKLFSPLAKLRLRPSERGRGDRDASDAGLGPRLLFKCEDGLILEYMDGMHDLTEAELHSPDAGPLLTAIASKLATLHSLPLPAQEGSSSDNGDGRGEVALWIFLERMLARIERMPHGLSPTITVGDIRGEVRRMRACADALALPIVHGHGDLKPSNVMSSAGNARVQFIDFELAGAHYRGYDLHKIFRTGLPFTPTSRANMELFLSVYREATGHPRTHAEGLKGGAGAEGTAPSVPLSALTQLRAEAAASEPLTWLEAAVFFWFAMAEFPAQATEWAPLAIDRWNKYRQTAHLIEQGGAAAAQLQEARERAWP